MLDKVGQNSLPLKSKTGTYVTWVYSLCTESSSSFLLRERRTRTRKGTWRTPCDQRCLFKRVSTRTSGVSWIAFGALLLNPLEKINKQIIRKQAYRIELWSLLEIIDLETLANSAFIHVNWDRFFLSFCWLIFRFNVLKLWLTVRGYVCASWWCTHG